MDKPTEEPFWKRQTRFGPRTRILDGTHAHWHHLANVSERSVRTQCSLMSHYFDHLFNLVNINDSFLERGRYHKSFPP